MSAFSELPAPPADAATVIRALIEATCIIPASLARNETETTIVIDDLVEDILAAAAKEPSPRAKAWTVIGDLANAEALDGDEADRLKRDGRQDYLLGRSDLSHSVLRIMAAAEAAEVTE